MKLITLARVLQLIFLASAKTQHFSLMWPFGITSVKLVFLTFWSDTCIGNAKALILICKSLWRCRVADWNWQHIYLLYNIIAGIHTVCCAGNVEWQDNQKTRCLVMWRSPSEWGTLVYKWVSIILWSRLWSCFTAIATTCIYRLRIVDLEIVCALCMKSTLVKLVRMKVRDSNTRKL